MLLEFKTKNFKSFVDETTFSMLAAPQQKGLDYSLFAVKNSRTSKGLCSSVLWSNAPGKPTVMDVLYPSYCATYPVGPNEGVLANPRLDLVNPNNSFDELDSVCFSIDFGRRYRIQ